MFKLLRFFLPVVSAFMVQTGLYAQMWNGTDTLYGNEWIDPSRAYYKIQVAEDGIYRISHQSLVDAGMPVGAIPADQYRLYRYGVQEPLFVSSAGSLGPGDYIEFFGEKNRSALDRHLFEQPENEMVNPEYSLFNDTCAYYLTWEPAGVPLRYAGAPNDLSGLPAPEPWVWFTQDNIYTTNFIKRRITPQITYSWFNGEGFSRGYNWNWVLNLAVGKIKPDGPPASLRVRYACELGEHRQRILVNDSLFSLDSFSGWRIVDTTFSLPVSHVRPTTKVGVSSATGSGDNNAISIIQLRYAREPDFENSPFARFSLTAAPGRRHLALSGLKTGGASPVLYDFSGRIRIQGDWDGTSAQFALPEAQGERQLWVATETAIKNAVPVPVQFRQLKDLNADYIILTNRRLLSDPTQNGANHVQAYADYRSSPAGGNHRVTIIDVDELYEQFAYGVRYHNIAIRNFAHWTTKNWDNPTYMLIIGKGMSYEAFRTTTQQTTFADSIFFVPSFGFFGADLLLTMKGASLNRPALAVGRLAVEKPSEIKDYLDKITGHEQELAAQPQDIKGKSWSKRVIHNCGGFNTEQLVIRDYAAELASTLEQNRFGAETFSFFKTSNDPIQLSSYDQMVDLVNEGVALWMIFGHSAAFAVDFDIGSVNAYNNKNRYPIMMVNGCASGRCTAPQKGLGEQFVLARDRGAIAFFATVNVSFIDALYLYSKALYGRAGGEDYGQGIGIALQNATGEMVKSSYNGLTAVAHQYQLQGDPAVSLYAHPGPDYVVDPQSVEVSPNPVSLDADSYRLSFEVRNIGEHVPGTLDLKVSQGLPGGALVLDRLSDSIPAPANRVKLTYELPNTDSRAGINRLFVDLDTDNRLAELPPAAEGNNQLADVTGEKGVDVVFFSNDVQLLAPDAYAIVNDPDVLLCATTFSLTAPVQRYLLEIDTTFTFDSPFKKNTVIQQSGGLLTWRPPVQWANNTVYYWRAARDSLVNGVVPWRTRSFIYLQDSPDGWNQSVYGQYRDNGLFNLKAEDQAKRLDFIDNISNLSLSVAYMDPSRYMGFQNSYYEGFYGHYGWTIRGINRGVGVVMLDPVTGRFVPNEPQSPWNPGKSPRFYYWFNTWLPEQRLELMNFLQHHIPDGYLAGLFAFNRPTDSVGYDPRAWAADSVVYGQNLFQVLESVGAKKVRELPAYTKAPWAYGLVFKKNDPSFTPVDTLARTVADQFEIRGAIAAKWPTGAFETAPIGPAKNWKSLLWRSGERDDPDEFETLTLYGVRGENIPDTLLLQLNSETDTGLQAFSAKDFPWLRLRYDGLDSTNRTFVPSRYLRILYDAVPEGALAPAAGMLMPKDTLQTGETMRAGMAFVNISTTDMDSVLVLFRIQDGANQQVSVYERYLPLLSRDTLQTQVAFDTRNLAPGAQRLLIDVNPDNDQPEQYHYNNVWVKDFYVSRDDRNPILDVTFDGVHILDGDLISPRPTVVVSLKDDNPYLPMNDTSTFFLQLENPAGSVRQIAFADPEVTFFPADPAQLPKKNTARLEWRPQFAADGNYRLLVNGRDATGNPSADLDYAIRFSVVSQASLGNILNYPNPFSTSTCFVYTMTGNEPPTRFNLQIMTVSGRVVREVTQMEFGEFKTGTHQSEFCWDGKDQYGDQLANGVYLYRIIAKQADGSDYPLREDSRIDGYFKNGFGKMVLIR